MTLALLSLLATVLAVQDPTDAYEGIARDDFAAWSYTTGQVAANGDSRTTSVMARYINPLPVPNSSRTVAYSIHEITFHCGARNSDWSAGANYDANDAEIGSGTASTAEPWSDSTPGYVQLAETVCSMGGTS